jgi:hypothetical protein
MAFLEKLFGSQAKWNIRANGECRLGEVSFSKQGPQLNDFVGGYKGGTTIVSLSLSPSELGGRLHSGGKSIHAVTEDGLVVDALGALFPRVGYGRLQGALVLRQHCRVELGPDDEWEIIAGSGRENESGAVIYSNEDYKGPFSASSNGMLRLVAAFPSSLEPKRVVTVNVNSVTVNKR